METSDLTVVIVTLKSEEVIFTCLDSIPSNIKVIVVENSNNKKLKEQLEEKYQNTKCILAGENNGYAIGNNIGLRKVNTKYALILNPDTELKKDTIENFFNTAKLVPDFWLIGPGNNQANLKVFDDNGLIEVNNLKGFAIFFNLIKFKKIFFDENFFLYFEEIDLCKNLKKSGGKIYLSKIFSSLIKIVFYQIIFNKEKRNIFICRLNGIINSILGKKSWYRPSLD